jgi:diadenosine tetraphosphate (Ap4A) HIT family hydrolase
LSAEKLKNFRTTRNRSGKSAHETDPHPAYDRDMPEDADQLYRRAAGALRTPPVHEWDTWPFDGELRPRTLQPPDPEPRISGAGGVDCRACTTPDSEYLWTDERWRLLAPPEPTGLPVIVLLEPRDHYAGPADLPEELAREQGVMLGLLERAVLSVGEIGRVHIGRWGEGAEHLHWWFIGRPAGMGQLRSSFAEIWDDVLPPTPKEIWDDNVARVVRYLEEHA